MALVVGLIIFSGYQIWAPAGASSAEPILVEIPAGAGVSQIAETLDRAGVIRSPTFFKAYAVLIGKSGKLQAGAYRLAPGLAIPEIISALAEGRAESTDEVVVIPEGSNVWEIDRLLVAAGLIKEGEFARLVWRREGRLFPDTYRFNPNASVDEIAAVLTDTFNQKTAHLKISPAAQALIIASLLEKEAKTTEDMRLIAGIIQKRLGLGMLLQIDATVSYGACLRESLAENFKTDCEVSQVPVRREIAVDGEFNTYLRVGLSPRPISNPGLRALEAALNPQSSDYLFYLSTRDGSRIIYAKTLEEHLQNRQKYLGI